VKPLDQLGREEANRLAGVVFDLDDTLLDHGALTEVAYRALFRLRDAGLRLIGCTGRPAGWGDVLARQWPIDAMVTENGAIAFVIDVTPGERRHRLVDELAPDARRARRGRLLEVAEEIIVRWPEMGLADDNGARRSDVTLDVGERRTIPVEIVRAAQALARHRGLRTLVSSVHMHLTLETEDKASGTIRLLAQEYQEDATAGRARYAFIGDSGNDAAAFGAFRTTFGVANVRESLGVISVPPRYVAPAAMGAGFAAIADRLCALRG
jgi:HAD superfamily hydrolase (TIGR01484 family)